MNTPLLKSGFNLLGEKISNRKTNVELPMDILVSRRSEILNATTAAKNAVSKYQFDTLLAPEVMARDVFIDTQPKEAQNKVPDAKFTEVARSNSLPDTKNGADVARENLDKIFDESAL